MGVTRHDGYVEVGAKCEPFTHEVSLGALTDLRDAVVDEYFMRMPRVSRQYSDEGTKVASAKAFHEHFGDAYESTPSIFGAAILRSMTFDDPDIDSWRLTIAQNRMQRSRHNNAPQRIVTRLKVEVFNDQIVEAVREVQVVRGVGELTAEAIEQQMIEDTEEGHIVMQRRAYERYLTENDCRNAAAFLGRIAARTETERGRTTAAVKQWWSS
ncbi:MAG: hypothetical protein WBK76_05110 [Candidatus Saccharimonadales bacterium]